MRSPRVVRDHQELVDDRNETAHPNGNIFYSTAAALDTKIVEILRVVAEIQRHSIPVIEHCYRESFCTTAMLKTVNIPTRLIKSENC